MLLFCVASSSPDSSGGEDPNAQYEATRDIASWKFVVVLLECEHFLRLQGDPGIFRFRVEPDFPFRCFIFELTCSSRISIQRAECIWSCLSKMKEPKRIFLT